MPKFKTPKALGCLINVSLFALMLVTGWVAFVSGIAYSAQAITMGRSIWIENAPAIASVVRIIPLEEAQRQADSILAGAKKDSVDPAIMDAQKKRASFNWGTFIDDTAGWIVKHWISFSFLILVWDVGLFVFSKGKISMGPFSLSYSALRFFLSTASGRLYGAALFFFSISCFYAYRVYEAGNIAGLSKLLNPIIIFALGAIAIWVVLMSLNKYMSAVVRLITGGVAIMLVLGLMGVTIKNISLTIPVAEAAAGARAYIDTLSGDASIIFWPLVACTVCLIFAALLNSPQQGQQESYQ